VQAVSWYLRYPLSYRDIEELFLERGLEVDHSTLNRWVLAYAPLIEKRLRQFRKPHCGSVRIDEILEGLGLIERRARYLGTGLRGSDVIRLTLPVAGSSALDPDSIPADSAAMDPDDVAPYRQDLPVHTGKIRRPYRQDLPDSLRQNSQGITKRRRRPRRAPRPSRPTRGHLPPPQRSDATQRIA
jgi:hypothetical protein